MTRTWSTLWITAMLAGCTLDPVELEGKLCPCAVGWHCDGERGVCVPAADRRDAGAPLDGSVLLDAGADGGRADGGRDASRVDAASGDAGADPDAGTVRGYRRTLTVPAEMVSGTLTDFPLLVAWPDDAGLAARARPDGSDLRFLDGTGATVLPAEIEWFDAETGGLVAWVLVPTLSDAAATTLYLEYGDEDPPAAPSPTAVWSGSYAGVWHFAEVPSDTAADVRDSSGRAHHGTSGGDSTPTRGAGAIGFGLSLDGAADQGVTIPDSGDWDLAARTATVSVWMRARTLQPGGDFPRVLERFEGGVPGDGWFVALRPDRTVSFHHRDDDTGSDADVGSVTALNDDRWHWVAVTMDGGIASLYVDGMLLETDGYSSLLDRDDALRFGMADEFGNNAFTGLLDEVRVLHGLRSAEWIATEHRNQSDPASFVLVGAETPVF